MEPQYVVLELLGHRQRAGWLSEEEIAGTGFLRIDIPQAGDPPTRSEWYSTAAVYAIHPSDEATVRQLNAPHFPLSRAALSPSEREDDWDNLWDHDEEKEPERDPQEDERALGEALVEDGPLIHPLEID